MIGNTSPPQITVDVDELCDRFWEALRCGERPRIEDWLAYAGPFGDAALPKLVAVELDHLIRAGEPGSALHYFARFPGMKSDPRLARELVLTEFHAIRSRDPQVTVATFRERYPDLADCFPVGDQMGFTIPQTGTIPFLEPPSPTPADRPLVSPHDPLVFLRDMLTPSDRPTDLGVLGDYRITGVLGHGGMGVVLRGEDMTLHRTVALKLMRPDVAADQAARERFVREARAMAALEHPRVVVLHQIGEWRGTPFLVMPLLKGRSLGQRLKDGPPIPVADAIRYVREAADGLVAAHARGLIHRDIKPDNMWLEETADGVHVRLLDFGLARDDAADPMTRTGTVFGTPSYMAPEQASGERVDGRADLFSLGCVLFELATGQKPFRGESITSILFALVNHVPPAPHTLNPAVPDPLSRLIQTLLAKKREDRPASADELAAVLRGMETDATPTAPEALVVMIARQPIEAPKKPSRRTLLIGAVALLSFGAAAVTARPFLRDEQVSGGGTEETHSSFVPSPVPLRVRALDVRHFASTDTGDVPKGVLGKESFSPLLNDRVQVVATLSRPAYAYVIAFRPDGEADLCFPDDEDTAPPLTITPRYPAADSGKAYGLREGTGLWAFAVVASETPLPPYRQWLSGRKLCWTKEPEVPTGSIWWYDGAVLEMFGEGCLTIRGKGEDLGGPAASVRAVGRWLAKNSDAKVGVIGFGVGPRK